ncbi:MAG: TonB family protein [Deltaproteobacteria bacterium]|nr:TonB family protein [Deltaproteobacteria bacterium]
MSVTGSEKQHGHSAAGGQQQGLLPCVIEGGSGRRGYFAGGKLVIGPGGNGAFAAKGIDAPVQIAGPSKSADQFYLFLTREMTGRIIRGNETTPIDDPSALGLRENNGRYALPVTKEMKVDLRIGEAVLRFSWEMENTEQPSAKKPSAAPSSAQGRPPAPPPASPGKMPVFRRAKSKDKDKEKKRGRIRMTTKPIRWVEIPVTDPGNKPMVGSFGLVATVCIGVLATLAYMRLHYLPPKDIAAPPPKIVTKLLVPEKPELPPPPPIEKPLEMKKEEVVEEPKADAKPDKAPNAEATREERRAQAKEQVKSQGLLAVLGSKGGPSASRDITRATSALQNVFQGLGAVTTSSKGDTDIKNLGGYGEAGGIDDAIAGLKAVKSNVGKTTAEKVDDSIVSGEAAGDNRRSYAAIAAVMRRYQPLLKSRHTRLLRTAPAAQGKITVEFTIAADGSVKSQKITDSAFSRYPEFEKEILDLIGKIRFEPIEKGEVRVAFPFIFTVSG